MPKKSITTRPPLQTRVDPTPHPSFAGRTRGYAQSRPSRGKKLGDQACAHRVFAIMCFLLLLSILHLCTNVKILSKNNSSRKAEDASMPIHMVQIGPFRTATTLQFESVCLSLFLKLENKTVPGDGQKRLGCAFIGGEHLSIRFFHNRTPFVAKSHSDNYTNIDDYVKTKTWVFTTAKTKKEAAQIKPRMERAGFRNVMLIQDLESVADRGHHIVRDYAEVFDLNSRQENELLEYMRYWDILRVCCGVQMSKKWRMEQWPEGKKGKGPVDVHDPIYPACSIYNITEVERMFMSVPLYKRITRNGLGFMAKPSGMDQTLDGTYCSWYNELVRTKGFGFNKKAPPRMLSNSTGGL